MIRREVRGRLAIVLGLGAGLSIGCGAEPDADEPFARNVVLVSIDTLRPDRLGAYGYARGTSPRLDALASRGLVFDDVISQAPWTAPAHAALFASTYPSVLGLGDWQNPGRVPDAAVLLAELLAARGFATCAITAGAFLDASFGFDQGFERYDDEFQRMRKTVDSGLAWLDARADGERFFLFLHTYDVHGYAPPPASVARLVRPYDGPLLEDAELSKTVQSPQRRLALERTTPADRRFLSDVYDAAIHSVDAQLGRLVDELDARGLLADTLVVVTSDHGEELYERGATGHGYTVYDENLRVPLVLAHPGLVPGRVPDLGRLIDVAPTIAALVGSPASDVPAGWIGRALLDARGRPLASRAGVPLAYSEYAHRPLVALRAGSAKLVLDTASGARELYDLGPDPGESVNLAGTGRAVELELTERVERLRAELERPPDSEASRDRAALDPRLAAELEALGYVGD